MGFIEDKQKAQAYDKMMQQQQIANVAEVAHTAGIDDGLAAAHRKLQRDKQLGYYSDGANVTNNEVNYLKSQLGRMPDMKDVLAYRKLQELEHLGINKNENGLAAQLTR